MCKNFGPNLASKSTFQYADARTWDHFDGFSLWKKLRASTCFNVCPIILIDWSNLQIVRELDKLSVISYAEKHVNAFNFFLTAKTIKVVSYPAHQKLRPTF